MPGSNWVVVAGLHFGIPAKKSVVLGVGRVIRRGPFHGGRIQRDVFLCAEPGQRGGRVSAGYGSFSNDVVRGVNFINARVSLFRRWSGDSGRVYLGPELSAFGLSDAVAGLRVGALRKVSGPGGRPTTLRVTDFPIGW